MNFVGPKRENEVLTQFLVIHAHLLIKVYPVCPVSNLVIFCKSVVCKRCIASAYHSAKADLLVHVVTKQFDHRKRFNNHRLGFACKCAAWMHLLWNGILANDLTLTNQQRYFIVIYLTSLIPLFRAHTHTCSTYCLYQHSTHLHHPSVFIIFLTIQCVSVACCNDKQLDSRVIHTYSN